MVIRLKSFRPTDLREKFCPGRFGSGFLVRLEFEQGTFLAGRWEVEDLRTAAGFARLKREQVGFLIDMTAEESLALQALLTW